MTVGGVIPMTPCHGHGCRLVPGPIACSAGESQPCFPEGLCSPRHWVAVACLEEWSHSLK